MTHKKPFSIIFLGFILFLSSHMLEIKAMKVIKAIKLLKPKSKYFKNITKRYYSSGKIKDSIKDKDIENTDKCLGDETCKDIGRELFEEFVYHDMLPALKYVFDNERTLLYNEAWKIYEHDTDNLWKPLFDMYADLIIFRQKLRRSKLFYKQSIGEFYVGDVSPLSDDETRNTRITINAIDEYLNYIESAIKIIEDYPDFKYDLINYFKNSKNSQ